MFLHLASHHHRLHRPLSHARLLFLLTLAHLLSSSVPLPNLPPVYWNVSNPIFSPHLGDSLHPPVINVKFGDSIDILCPLLDPVVEPLDESDRLGFFTLYRVTRAEFDSCVVRGPLEEPDTKWIFDCKQPFKYSAFTINVVEYSPLPKGLQFEAGRDYYFTSTSTGRADGIGNLDGGVCRSRGMKLVMRVCCRGEGGVEDGAGSAVNSVADFDRFDDDVFVPGNDVDDDLRFSGKVTRPAPTPGRVYPSPKILRVITVGREKQTMVNAGAGVAPFSAAAPGLAILFFLLL